MNIVEITLTPTGSPDLSPAKAKTVRPPIFLRPVHETRPDTGRVNLGGFHGLERTPTGVQKAAIPTDFDARAVVGNTTETEEMQKYVPDHVRKVPRWKTPATAAAPRQLANSTDVTMFWRRKGKIDGCNKV